jgi:DNA-binding transcriptional LysR family regulator
VHLAQSSLSTSIGALEKELGDALFVRDNRRVALTAAGRALLPAARRALVAAEEGRAAVAGVLGALHGEVRIGAIQTLGVVELGSVLAGFRRAHPGVTIRLSHGASGVLARAVADAELDVAFVDGPTDPARLTRTELGHDDLVLAVRRDDPLAGRAFVRLAETALGERDFVDYRADSALHAQIDAACADAGLARRVSCEVGTMPYLVDCVRHGLGIALVPPMAVRDLAEVIAAVPVRPPLRRTIAAVAAAHRPPTAAARAFLTHLPAAAPSTEGS